MEKVLFDYDPLLGLKTWWTYDELSDTVTMTYEQDLADVVDYTRSAANDEERTKAGIKKGMWHYAHIPTTVIIELRSKGIDIYNKDHEKAMIREINTNYPHLRTTHKWHGK